MMTTVELENRSGIVRNLIQIEHRSGAMFPTITQRPSLFYWPTGVSTKQWPYRRTAVPWIRGIRPFEF
ncbi:hypothetical protein SLEP1_g47288 [Rubroshorea leprosula]|uniref:Uncharacterized protein n=1 Tax=Rubroshorea leprosula TaxID=152421 RepID=A0AAV5LPY9_9ROSI|nr:hypothetical protein SLEP1_g47288 [Rubroshorea leprosula]